MRQPYIKHPKEPEFDKETSRARIARLKNCEHEIVPNPSMESRFYMWKTICSKCGRKFRRAALPPCETFNIRADR